MRGTRPVAIAWLACILVAFFLQAPAPARDGSTELRREKARLLEMKAREEKTAAELSEALRKEKLTKGRVNELRGRLKAQRGVIAGIDRRLSVLGERLDETEKEVRELTEAQGKARRGLRQAAALAFESHRADLSLLADRSCTERSRYLMRGYLGADLEDVERLSRERKRKEEELSGIERQVEISEKRMTRAQEVGEKLLSRTEAERKRLSGIKKEKQEKQRELRALRAKIARMESLVARVERLAKERERIRKRKAMEAARKGAKPPAAAEAPKRFASLAGGLSSPLPGKIVSRFGRQHDPTFDVTIENHGVEIEGVSGSPVKAAGSGEVAFTGAVSGFGNVLILQHGSGLFSVYGKLDDFSVKTGQDVAKGQAVGRLPASPSGKSVLYFELRAGGTAIDPASVIPLNR
ncbi:MAG: peptidoglycan DD-metalloendopeptidase family protein [Deltaproteobacteria bacterium]|nr:peptidoglycan DD-metalloendopeptidase family protein [Deltaproteobacteria bacterium]